MIQCAGKKIQYAGCLTNGDETRVLFVANPEVAPPRQDTLYARPDDIAEDGKSWRKALLAYNKLESNPLKLSPAYLLYNNPVYEMLVDRYCASNVFILSAGWGLIKAKFLTPNYDITFSSSAESYKRRKKQDNYNDLSMLPLESEDDLVFFGGKDYQPFFYDLTKTYRGNRFVFYNSDTPPNMPGCKLIKYQTSIRTNWHYECAKDFVAGAVDICASTKKRYLLNLFCVGSRPFRCARRLSDFT